MARKKKKGNLEKKIEYVPVWTIWFQGEKIARVLPQIKNPNIKRGLLLMQKSGHKPECPYLRICRELAAYPDKYEPMVITPRGEPKPKSIPAPDYFACCLCPNRENADAYNEVELNVFDIEEIFEDGGIEPHVRFEIKYYPVMTAGQWSQKWKSSLTRKQTSPKEADHEIVCGTKTMSLRTPVKQKAIRKAGLILLTEARDLQLFSIDRKGQKREIFFRHSFYFELFVKDEGMTYPPKGHSFFEAWIDGKVFPLGLHGNGSLAKHLQELRSAFPLCRSFRLFSVQLCKLKEIDPQSLEALINSSDITDASSSGEFKIRVDNDIYPLKNGLTREQALAKADAYKASLSNTQEICLLTKQPDNSFREECL